MTPRDFPTVAELQEMLGLLGRRVPVTGQFCQATRTALRAFQIDTNDRGPTAVEGAGVRYLRADGAADSRTIEALRQAVRAAGKGDA